MNFPPLNNKPLKTDHLSSFLQLLLRFMALGFKIFRLNLICQLKPLLQITGNKRC